MARVVFTVLSLFIVCTCFAGEKPIRVKPYSMFQYDIVLQSLYDKRLGVIPFRDTRKRIDVASRYFLNKPYFLGSLGEGKSARFDQNPLYRTTRFDCVTYVETVLALVHAKTLNDFRVMVKRIRYHNEHANFFSRNHFTSVDWNPNMHRLGLIKDITTWVYPRATMAHAFINKPAWYRHMQPSNLKLIKLPKAKMIEKRVDALHDHARRVGVHYASVSYIPLSVLFKKEKGKWVVNQAIFSKIPDGTVIEIVRNPYHTKKLIGTNLLVSHMGLGIRKQDRLFFRNASSLKNRRVIDVPLDVYLKRYYTIVHPREFGIHIEKIL